MDAAEPTRVSVTDARLAAFTDSNTTNKDSWAPQMVLGQSKKIV